jgi:hypothetical protein
LNTILKEDFEKLVALLKHPALPGMGAVGREAAALIAKVEHAIAALTAVETADATPVEAEQAQSVEVLAEVLP